MADLGSIKQQNVAAGVVPVDRTAGVNAVKGALNLTEKLITEKAEGELRGELQEDAEEALSLSNESQPLEFDKLPGDTAVVEFTNSMSRLSAIALQAQDSQSRTRAQLEMQKTLSDAKNKYGWLRDELDREAAQFMGASPELAELGLSDAQGRAGGGKAGAAQAEIDLIMGKAFGNGDLDLNMDPGEYRFGTIEFATEYQKRAATLNQTIELEQSERLLLAQDRRSAREQFRVSERELRGPEGGIARLHNAVLDGYKQVQSIRDSIKLGDSSAQTANALGEAEELFNTSIKPNLLIRLNEGRADAIRRHSAIWGTTEGSLSVPSGDALAERSRQQLLDELSGIDTLIELIEKDNPDVTAILRNAAFLRTARNIEQAPGLQVIADLAMTRPNFVNNMEKFGLGQHFSTEIDNYLRGEGLAKELDGMLERGAVFHLDASSDPSGSPQDYLDRQDQNRRNSPSMSGTITDNRDPKAATAANVSYGQQTLAAFKSATNPAEMDQDRSQAYLNNDIWMTGNILDNDTMQFPEDREQVRGMDANPLLYAVVMMMPEGRDSVLVQAYALSKQKYWISNKRGDSRTGFSNEIIEIAQTPVGPGQIPAVQFMDPNTENLKSDGEISLTVNRERVEQAFGIGVKRDRTAPFNELVATQSAEAAYNNLVGIAAELGRKSTQFIQIDTFYNWVGRPNSVKNYVASLVQGGETNSLARLFGVELK